MKTIAIAVTALGLAASAAWTGFLVFALGRVVIGLVMLYRSLLRRELAFVRTSGQASWITVATHFWLAFFLAGRRTWVLGAGAFFFAASMLARSASTRKVQRRPARLQKHSAPVQALK